MQPIKPFNENFSFANFNNDPTVSNWLHIVKQYCESPQIRPNARFDRQFFPTHNNRNVRIKRELVNILELQRKRIDPLELRKTGKIRISGGQIASVFYCKSSQMCVCNQIGYSLPTFEHHHKYSPMLFGRLNNSCARLIQPALYTGKSLFKGKRVFEDPWICPYPNKCG